MVYILQDDEIGRVFSRALRYKAKQGVRVRLVIDAVGSFSLSASFLEELEQAGVEVFIHHRLRLLRLSWFRYLIRRNHRKILVVDRSVAFTGGFNIVRECSRKYHGDQRWFDMMAETRQPRIVALLLQQFHDACRRARHEKWTTRLLTRSGNKAIVANDRHVYSYSMSRWVKRRLRHARTRIVIAVPYFVPYGFFWRILVRKLKQDVEVEIILSENSDLKWIDSISFFMARRLSDKGAKVYLYRGAGTKPRFSHAKFIMVDGWAGTGSANYDYRSMVLNLDTLLFFRRRMSLWRVHYDSLKNGARLAVAGDLRGGIRAWLLWPLRWLM
jgi:cardiolipin synthase A/B